MTKTPYKPREVSKIDATIFKELIFSKRSLAVFPKDPSKKIRFFEGNTSNVIEKRFSFSLQVGQQKVDLSIEFKPGTPLAKRLEEVGGLEALPEEFRVALMTFVTQEIIDSLEHLFQLPITGWDGTKKEEEVSERKNLYFEILDAGGHPEARASMTVSISLLERVLEIAQKVPTLKNVSLTGEYLEGEVFIGGALVPLEDWNKLKPGDLILIQEPSALTTGKARCLIKKSETIPMMVDPNLFKTLVVSMEKIFPMGLKPVSPLPELQEEQKNSTLISIPLELNFSAGLVSLTIEETLQLIKTKSLKKPLQLSRPLKIFIQEEIVGTGELVEINGCHALAVTQLFNYAS